MVEHFTDKNDLDDTDARWEPIPDDVWETEDAAAYPGSGELDGDDALEPARTMVRPRPVDAAPAVGSYVQDSWQEDAGEPYAPREPRVSQREAWGGGASRPASRPTRERAPRPRRSGKHGCLSALLWLVMLGVVAFMALRCLP